MIYNKYHSVFTWQRVSRERVAQEERLAEEKRVANEAAALLAREVAAAEAARLEGERLRLEAENEVIVLLDCILKTSSLGFVVTALQVANCG